MNINDIFSFIEEKNFNAIATNITNLKIKNLIDLNNLEYLNLVLTKRSNPTFNLLEKDTLIEYGIDVNDGMTPS